MIESPTSYGPVSPIGKNFYLAGFVIGLLAGAFMVLLKEILAVKYYSVQKLKIKLKFLLWANWYRYQQRFHCDQGWKRTVVAEQFRSIRTNLAFMGLNEEQNTLMVTSSISGEGKSFVAINLAISFTLTGKKVALMEMDLRKPKLSKILNVKKTPGISSYLVGKATLDEIIKETEIPGLFIVSAGPFLLTQLN